MVGLMVGHLSFPTYLVRTGIAAGSPVPIDLMKSLISKLNLKDLTNAYGMSGLLFWITLFWTVTIIHSRD